ncbi:glycosyltransferase family 2 protein [Phormidesmis priestleyi]|uniref:glycosyltransferase family 2 protein n=1 Tax=Phormidesmis priestleyi TaxID=268141 RepID=UPI00083AACE3|nr:glycosyltransferase family 2 protein [Phormidesmis priestleyi]
MITVITPVYNGEKFIESCIEVVIEQACSEVEHLIIDGGSCDRTLAIVQQYAEEFAHIRWISEKDKGQSDAMNKGVLLAKNEIIGFLNVDDYYEPGVLNRILEVFKDLPNPSFVVGNCNIWQADGTLWTVNRPAKLKLSDLLLGFHVNPFPMNPSAYFYHRSLHEKVGPYQIDDHYTMDVEFILRAVQAATVHYFDQLWGNYQMLEGTKTVTDFKNGQGKDRVGLLLRTYRSQLPQPQKARVGFLYSLLEAKYKLRWFLIHRRDELRLYLKEFV